MKLLRHWPALLLGILYIITGFFREFVFLNVNEQMRVSYYHATDSQVAPSMQFLSSFSYSALYYGKWPLTLLFTAIFAAIAAYIIRFLFRDRTFVRITLWAYAAVFFTGFLFYAAGYLVGWQERFYVIARFLAGIVETPALLIVLIPTFFLMRQPPRES